MYSKWIVVEWLVHVLVFPVTCYALSQQWTQERAQLTAQAATAREALSRLERAHETERLQAIREVTIAQTQRDEQRTTAMAREADLKRELEQAQGIL